MFLQAFKNFQEAHRLDLDELVELDAAGQNLRDSYERNKIPEPEFIETQLKSIRRVIRARRADALELKRAQVKRQLDGLKTPTQRAQDLKKQLSEIDEELAEVG